MQEKENHTTLGGVPVTRRIIGFQEGLHVIFEIRFFQEKPLPENSQYIYSYLSVTKRN